MAKKKTTTTTRTTTHTTTNNDIIKFCGYWGLIIAAIAALLSFIFGLLHICGIDISWSGRVIGLCNTISQIALLVTVILAAYRSMRGKSVVYRAFCWVAVIFVILGLIGLNLGF